jgi:hypothetical protein
VRPPSDRKATGPTSVLGKARSAINAVKHGLAGRGLLLPGEDVREYEVRLDGIFASLAPRNDAEAEMAALIGDDIHKLNRLAKLEKGVTLGRVEELLALTGSGEMAGVITNAIQALGQALVAWSAEPVPTTKTTDFQNRYKTIVDAVSYVENTVQNVHTVLVEACQEALEEVRGKKDNNVVSGPAYAATFKVTRELMTALLDLGRDQDAEQDRLRAAISGIALPDEAELKKLARYRAMLEVSVQRRLAALEQVRKLTAGNVADQKDVERAKEYRVKLRVVA